MTISFYDMLFDRAKAYKAKKFLITDKQEYSYDAILSKVNSLEIATNLTNELVLVVADNPVTQFILFIAMQKAGAIPIIMHPKAIEVELQGIAGENNIGYFAELNEAENAIILTKAGGSGNELAGTYDLEQASFGVLSSGSTGMPKVMLRTYAGWADFFADQNRIFEVDEDTSLFLQGSISFTGNFNAWLSVLFAGGSIISPVEGTTPRSWVRLSERYKATHIYLVPTKLRLLLRGISKHTEGNHNVKMIFTGSGLLNNSDINDLTAQFPRARILLYYGASEVGFISYRDITKGIGETNNVGRPFTGVTVAIASDGEILIDTPYAVMAKNLPIALGDKGSLNDRGEIIFNGRSADFVNKGGYKISCTKVEMAISSIAGVAEVAVIPIEHQSRGMDIVAFYTWLSESEQDIKLAPQLKTILPALEIPARIIRLNTMPYNTAGKIDKKELKRLWNSGEL